MSGGWVDGQPEWSFSKYTFTLPHCALGQECFKQVWLNSGQRLCPQPPWTGWRRLGVSPPKGGLLAGILKSSQREPESPFPLVKRSPVLGFAWVSLPASGAKQRPFYYFLTWGDLGKARCKYESLPAASGSNCL